MMYNEQPHLRDSEM